MIEDLEKKQAQEELDAVKSIVLAEKVKQVENGTLHTSWISWYKNRKVVSKKQSLNYLNTMIKGMANDFYLVIAQQQNHIDELNRLVEYYKNGIHEESKVSENEGNTNED